MIINKIANIIIIIGLLLLFFIYSPVLLEEADYQFKKNSYQDMVIVDDHNKVEEVKMDVQILYREKIIIPKSFDFSLVIPKIGVNSQVFPNIDSGDELEYLPVLKQGVAHAKNSSLPDESGVTYIFAHSTDSFYNITHYNAAFYLLNKLEKNDEILVFYKNKKYTYQVESKKEVEPETIAEELLALKGDYLVLQTCWPPGTTLKRLLVISVPKSKI